MAGSRRDSAAGRRAVRRVLVVDDDDGIRDLLSLAFRGEGYEVVTAQDGSEALQLLRERRPDLILLDLMMPGMDGWTFRTQLRAEVAAANVPVIVLTAGQHPRRRVDALDAAAIFPKPFDVDLLLATVARLSD